jgi:hypothetical protein
VIVTGLAAGFAVLLLAFVWAAATEPSASKSAMFSQNAVVVRFIIFSP